MIWSLSYCDSPGKGINCALFHSEKDLSMSYPGIEPIHHRFSATCVHTLPPGAKKSGQNAMHATEALRKDCCPATAVVVAALAPSVATRLSSYADHTIAVLRCAPAHRVRCWTGCRRVARCSSRSMPRNGR